LETQGYNNTKSAFGDCGRGNGADPYLHAPQEKTSS
jgi:hypothetical protein